LNGFDDFVLFTQMSDTRVRRSGVAIATRLGFALADLAPTMAAALLAPGPSAWLPLALFTAGACATASIAGTLVAGRMLMRRRTRLTTINHHNAERKRAMIPSLFRHSAQRAGGSWIIGALGAVLVAAGCTITPPPRAVVAPPPAAAAAVNSITLDQYRKAVAQRILERNPSFVLRGAPQAMLRSLVVVAFTVDRDGRIVKSAVYRTNGDDETETTALATLRRAAPLPQPPSKLLNSLGQLELMEDWLFNDNGKFQLRSFASPQSLTID
jgi:protein TonB